MFDAPPQKRFSKDLALKQQVKELDHVYRALVARHETNKLMNF